MYDEDWDSEEPGYPRAPLPPHERTWRHPSELGFVAQQQFAPRPPRLPRLILVGVGAVGVAAAAGLVMLLAPRSGGSGIQTSSRVLPVEAGDVVGFDSVGATVTTAKRRPSSTTAPRTRKPVAQGQVQGRRSLSTMLLSGVQRVAVAVGDGRHALTTANSLEVDQLVDVVVGEGSTVVGRVLSVSDEQNIAVLELDRVMSSVARKVAYTTPQNGDRVTVGQDAVEATVQVSGAGLQIDTELVAQDGEPVVDTAGRLVGLVSRSADGTLHLVTIPRLAALKATVLVIDVWLGLRFEPDSLQVVEATADAPATLAGIQPGDALTAIGDSRLTCIDDLWVELAFMRAGQTVSVEFLRDGVAQSAEVTLAARPS